MVAKKIKILFLCAHPDDLEYFLPNTIIECGNRGYSVTIASMTKGEYGSLTPNLCGEKLGKIREAELRSAAKINGVKDVRVLGLTDGHVTITKEHIIKLKRFLDELRPDIIFCPEAYFTFYWHHDHVNTGRMVYHILTKYFDTKPKLFFYHSYKNNFFIPVRHMSRARRALKAHSSQFQIIGFMLPLRYIFMIINGLRLPYLFVEATRRVYFTKNENSIRNLKNRFFYSLFSRLKYFQAPKERKD
ncbi:MAG: PIG-L deacetylase family protein [Candidatus Helarchaeota archaeon]